MAKAETVEMRECFQCRRKFPVHLVKDGQATLDRAWNDARPYNVITCPLCAKIMMRNRISLTIAFTGAEEAEAEAWLTRARKARRAARDARIESYRLLQQSRRAAGIAEQPT